MINATNYVGHRVGIDAAVDPFDFVANFVIFPLAGIGYGYSTWEYRSRPTPGKIGSS
jgi:hypothetical protein